MKLNLNYPAIADLRRKAKQRIPHFAFEYLDSGTGSRELGVSENRQALDQVKFLPTILKGEIKFQLDQEFMGETFSYPFGIAPVGMAGAMWPGAEKILARIANEFNIPFNLSTVATASPEDIGPIARNRGWFQYYPARDRDIQKDMLRRVKNSGFTALVVTLDVPGESRRERQRKAFLELPFKLNYKLILSILSRPAWCKAILFEGIPRMKFPESYTNFENKGRFTHVGKSIRGYPNWDDFKRLREDWPLKLIVKGVLDSEDAKKLIDEGADGIWVSNHSGRQFEGGPAAINQLPKIREAVGDNYPLAFDSGLEGGLDILRAYALGADYVFLGRGFIYAVAAFGSTGAKHLVNILAEDLKSNMAQIGISHPNNAQLRLIKQS